jgi:hypothetical protein
LVVALGGGGIFAFFALSVTTSLKIPGAVIPRRVFTRPGARKSLMHRSKEQLFDHLVGAHEERRRDRQAKRFGSPHVDSEVETRGTLER